jgi:hypothetical protein
MGVHGELILKLLREAGKALGSESVNGSYSMWFEVWDYLQLYQPAYHRQVSYGCDVGCNRLAIKKRSCVVYVFYAISTYTIQ